MASSNSVRHLWKEYTMLKNWLSSSDPASNIFIDQTPDDEAETNSRPTDSRTNAGTQGAYLCLLGLIFPSTAPFGKRGLQVEIRVPTGYRQEPPVVYMKTKIRHPNIEKDGRICTILLDQAKKYVAASLPDVVKIVVKLMEEPERGHVVDAEMGSLYDANINDYNAMITKMVTDLGVPRPRSV